MRCHAGSARLPPWPVGCQLGVCSLASPKLLGGASPWHRHCSIPQAAFADPHAPALFPGTQGAMTGGRLHDPVTVATAPEHPGWPCWHRPCRRIPACALAPSTMVSNPGAPGPGSQVPVVDLVDETFPVQASSGRATPLDVILSPGVVFEPCLIHRACVLALKCMS